jgi:cyclopropane-fatty-acyl-phospholipid synthase
MRTAALKDGKASRRLDRFRRLLTHINERILPDLGFVLWDGSTVPADLRSDALAFAIADEGAIAAMIRRPNVDTFLDLWVTSRFDLRNGSFFDLAACRPKVRTRELMKSFDKLLAAATLGRFLFVPRGGPWPLQAVRNHKTHVAGTEATNKTNIHYHYDLSNRFYELFLDPEMVYSCAYFKDWDNDLATAQVDKLDMICRKLRLNAGDTLLDIGCGWGALVCHAASRYGVRAHGVTLAEEQLAYAREKVARLGLQDKVTLELRDYARLEGSFDKIASIGMFEHVGIANHAAYFQTINRLLNPGGLYLHHAIALRSKSFERFRRRRRDAAAATAIGRYIFPGGELDHVGMSVANLEMHNFEVHDVEAWREHYMRTTRYWHDRLSANRDAAEREVGREKTRLWIAYLAVVSIAFEQGTTGIFQTLASKRVRGPSGLPPTRADLYR